MNRDDLTQAERIVDKVAHIPSFVKSTELYGTVWYECVVCSSTTRDQSELHDLENHAEWCVVREAREYMADKEARG